MLWLCSSHGLFAAGGGENEVMPLPVRLPAHYIMQAAFTAFFTHQHATSAAVHT